MFAVLTGCHALLTPAKDSFKWHSTDVILHKCYGRGAYLRFSGLLDGGYITKRFVFACTVCWSRSATPYIE